MSLTIVVPFPDAEHKTAYWAVEESSVDFRRDPVRAARCTCAFAATELQAYLQRTVADLDIVFASQPPKEGPVIELRMLDMDSMDEAFILDPRPDGLQITGRGRTGVLYGVYEFLRMQGWRWYAPGRMGECAPAITDHLVWPTEPIEGKPALPLGRGFDFEGVSKESAELCLWMARNRLNVSGYRPATGPLGAKLGMHPKNGGHIFEDILDPDRRMPSGKTLWEEHQEWYGLPADGVRRKAEALRTQFCVSQPDLLEFLGEELLAKINGSWKEADRIDVWGFDTWGSTCHCDKCRALGNSTDQTLVLLASLRATVDKARTDGRLDHDVCLVMCAYEGTATIMGPERPVPENLIHAGDCAVFYPINRCYAHDFYEPSCSINRRYADALASWFKQTPSLPVSVGGYYNVSTFEDLPLLFTTRISHDLTAYRQMGARGITYMHVPLVNWGLRAITQTLYAQLAWDAETDVPAFVEEYFARWYGPYAERMRAVYERVEEAWLHIASWRSWHASSVLSQLLRWDGARPQQDLLLDDHLVDAAGAIAQGRRSVALLSEALCLLDGVRKDEQAAGARMPVGQAKTAVNPVEARKLEQARWYEMRLGEDRRLLLYGLDTMGLMVEMVAYHQALRLGDARQADASWATIEQLADKLDSYYIPIGFEWPGAGLESKDALTRSQLRELVRRCRQARQNA